MAQVDELSVRVAADTADFQASAQRVESQLGDISSEAIQTAAALEVLSSRSNDAEGEIRELGRGSLATSGRIAALGSSATSTATTLTGLSAAASAASVSFTSLANTPLAIMLPVLTAGATALLSTLFPLAAVVGTLTAGAGALAAAFGAVVGSGLLAFGEQRGEQAQQRLNDINAQIARLEQLQETEEGLTGQQEQRLENLQEEADTLEEQTGIMGGLQAAMSDLGDELAPLITEFGEAFIPLIEDAIDGLPDLVEDVLDAAGGLEVFQETLRDLGEEAADALPGIVEGLVDVAEEALPPFLDLIDWLGNNAESIFRGMLRVTQRLAPTLLDFGRAFARATPEITRLGTIVLETLVPAFTDFLGLIEDVIQIGQGSNSLVSFLSNLVNGALTWIESTGAPMIRQVAGNLIGALITAIQPTEEGGSGQLNALISRVGGWLEDLSTWVQGPGGQTITNTMRELFDAMANALDNLSEEDLQGGVDSLLGVIAGVFDSVSNAVASEEGGEVSQAIGRVTGDIMAAFADSLVAYVRSDAFQEDLDQFANATESAIEESLKGMSIGLGDANFEVFGEEISIPLGFGQNPDRLPNPDTSSLEEVRQFVMGPNSMDGRRITQGERRWVEQETPFTVEVTVDGDVGVVRDTAAEVVNEEQRRTRMNQGRSMNPN